MLDGVDSLRPKLSVRCPDGTGGATFGFGPRFMRARWKSDVPYGTVPKLVHVAEFGRISEADQILTKYELIPPDRMLLH